MMMCRRLNPKVLRRQSQKPRSLFALPTSRSHRRPSTILSRATRNLAATTTAASTAMPTKISRTQKASVVSTPSPTVQSHPNLASCSPSMLTSPPRSPHHQGCATRLFRRMLLNQPRHQWKTGMPLESIGVELLKLGSSHSKTPHRLMRLNRLRRE